MQLLQAWGLVEASRGRRARVVSAGEPAEPNDGEPGASEAILDDIVEAARPTSDGQDAMAAPQLWEVTVCGPDGRRYPPRHVTERIDRVERFRPHLLAIARVEAPERTDAGTAWIGDFELEVREVGREDGLPVLTLRWQQETQ